MKNIPKGSVFHNNEPDEPGILERSFHEGSSAAFKEIILRYQQEIYTFGLWMYCNHEYAATFCKEVFVRAFKQRKAYNPNRSVLLWLLHVAIRQSRKKYLRTKNELFDESKGKNAASDIEVSSFRKKNWNIICSVLSKMNRKYRLVIALHFSSGLHLSVIAGLLGISTDNTMHYLHNSLNMFDTEYSIEQV